MCIASATPIIKIKFGTMYEIILISRLNRPIKPSSHIAVIITVRIGRNTCTQFLNKNPKTHKRITSTNGTKIKLSLNINKTNSVLNTVTPDRTHCISESFRMFLTFFIS